MTNIDITTADRALRAEAALGAFTEQTGGDSIEPSTISDLIGDLGHYCDAHDIDFLQYVRVGIAHWHAEKVDSDDPDLMPSVSITIDGGRS